MARALPKKRCPLKLRLKAGWVDYLTVGVPSHQSQSIVFGSNSSGTDRIASRYSAELDATAVRVQHAGL
jgi:hypothetical protein